MTDINTPAGQFPKQRAFDAVAYWRQYEVTRDFAGKPYPDPAGHVKGTIEALREAKNTDGAWVPRLAIRQDDGILVLVTAHQSRLLAELVLSGPAVGDRIEIRYLGPDDRAAPGMSPTKRFAVRSYTPGEEGQATDDPS